MIILPAIDLLDGEVVRLRQGKLEDKTVYSKDALAFARRWEEEGGNCLHVVDLNAAFTGEQRNLAIVETLVKSLNIPVQVGGGVRSIEAARKLLDIGAERVVVGTRAVADPKFLKNLTNEFGGDCVAASVDAKDGKLAVKGWSEITEIDALDYVSELDELGVSTIIFTDIATDGMLTGPNFDALDRVLSHTNSQVISSGGVASIDQIRRLALTPRLHGLIIGKALFDGDIELSEAVAVAGFHSHSQGAV